MLRFRITALDAYGVLFCMCILACVALWPRSDEETDPDVAAPVRNWADRVEMKRSVPTSVRLSKPRLPDFGRGVGI